MRDTVDKCEMCNGRGIVGGHAQDGSFDAMDCPECTAKYEHPCNDEVAMTIKTELLPCPFCWRDMHLVSNRDWHCLHADHGENCIFETADILSVPASDDKKNALIRDWNTRLPPTVVSVNVHHDDMAVDKFAAAMKEKLAKKRAQGYGGWEDKERCSAEHLQNLLIGHLAKGAPVDIGNFAMMLWNRGESVAAPAVEPQPATLEEIAAEEENVKPRQIHIIDAETRALAISICEHVLSHTHPWAFIDEAKKLKKLLGAE